MEDKLPIVNNPKAVESMFDKDTTIIHLVKKGNFTTVSNDLIREKRLSWRARGILMYLLSQESHWTVRLENIVDFGTEGRDAVRNAFNECKELGYVKTVQCRGEEGVFSITKTYVRESLEIPFPEEIGEIQPFTEKPRTDYPATEKPRTENPTLINTKDNENKYLNQAPPIKVIEFDPSIEKVLKSEQNKKLQRAREKLRRQYSPLFRSFVARFEHSGGLDDCWAAWQAVLETGVGEADLDKAGEAYANKFSDKKFMVSATKWLCDREWEKYKPKPKAAPKPYVGQFEESILKNGSPDEIKEFQSNKKEYLEIARRQGLVVAGIIAIIQQKIKEKFIENT